MQRTEHDPAEWGKRFPLNFFYRFYFEAVNARMRNEQLIAVSWRVADLGVSFLGNLAIFSKFAHALHVIATMICGESTLSLKSLLFSRQSISK